MTTRRVCSHVLSRLVTGPGRRGAALLLTLSLLLAAGLLAVREARRLPPSAEAAQAPTPTPLQLQFPEPTATEPALTATPTRTPTVVLNNFVEARANDTNVRAGPDINAERVGLIYPGTQYRVLARRFEWYQIEFPESPTGSAWVHNSVVDLTGNLADIPEVELEQIPTIDPTFIAAQETARFVRETPGALATLTAAVEVTPTGVFTTSPDELFTLDPSAIPPTFTEPPYTNTPIVIPRGAPVTTSTGGLPPIVPILALAALGLMGLLVGLLRRL